MSNREPLFDTFRNCLGEPATLHVIVAPATAPAQPLQPAYDVFIAPSGARYDYSGSRALLVTGVPSEADEVAFIRHVAGRRSFEGVRVLGVDVGVEID